jgi:hypothetical protein
MKREMTLTGNGVFCRLNTSLADVMTIMWNHNYRTLPVINQAAKVVGIITLHDISNIVATKGRLASKITVREVLSAKDRTCASHDDLPPDHIIHVLAVGRHEIWYRIDGQGIIALHKPTELDPTKLHFSSLESLEQNLALIEQEFDRACPGCAEARVSPMLAWSDVETVYGAETTLDGHRFRVYRERFEDGRETITVVHTSDHAVDDYCYENPDDLEAAWPGIISQVNATCTGCTQQGE